MFRRCNSIRMVATSLGLLLVALLGLASYHAFAGPTPSTRLVPDSGDQEVIVVKSLMLPYDLDKLIRTSDVIVTGQVIDIRPSEWGHGYVSTESVIHTDVIVETQSYLLGATEASPIAVRTLGGRVDGIVYKYDGGPEFTVGEAVVLYLDRLDVQEGDLPDGIARQDVYRVIGGFQGKAQNTGGVAIHSNADIGEIRITDLALKIRSIRPQVSP